MKLRIVILGIVAALIGVALSYRAGEVQGMRSSRIVAETAIQAARDWERYYHLAVSNSQYFYVEMAKWKQAAQTSINQIHDQ